MPSSTRELSEFRGMWLFTMFDLPVDTKEARRRYRNFRTALLKEGLTMMQFSVYARYCSSEERSKIYRNKLRAMLPPEGHIRFLTVTDYQFGKMEVFYGKTRAQPEKPPEQVFLF